MVALLLEVFGDWETGIVSNVMIADVTDDEAETAVVHVINKETSQTHLRVGHLSVKETDLDYVPLVIANDILGGTSFIGRLFNEVRTKHGLAYSVGSELSPGMSLVHSPESRHVARHFWCLDMLDRTTSPCDEVLVTRIIH